MKAPTWTVLYNVVSVESPTFVGTGWEFFDDQALAQKCYQRHADAGNCPTRRPFNEACDRPHMGAVHRMQAAPSRTTDDPKHPGINVPTASGQNEAYLVLSEAERAKGFVRPYRDAYRHVGLRPTYPLLDLTDEQRQRVGSEFDKFEAFPGGSSAVGRYWTAAELTTKCGAVTTMGRALSETYARDPKFYGSTFCARCNAHFRVAQFVWDVDGQVVGS